MNKLRFGRRREERQGNHALDRDTNRVLKQLQWLGRRRNIIPLAWLTFLGGGAVVTIFESWQHLTKDNWIHNVYFTVSMSLMLASIVIFQLCYFDVARRAAILSVLDEIDDIQALGALVDALDVVNTRTNSGLKSPASDWKRDVPNGVSDALKRLLRQMQPEDVCYLNGRQYMRLHRALFPILSPYGFRTIYDPLLALQIVRVLGRIGNRESLPYLSRLINAQDTEEPMREEAQKSLALIQERLSQQQQASDVLLRPSTAAELPKTLLRPVADSHQANSEAAKLLRPSAEVSPAANRDNAPLQNYEPLVPQTPAQQVQIGTQTTETER